MLCMGQSDICLLICKRVYVVFIFLYVYMSICLYVYTVTLFVLFKGDKAKHRQSQGKAQSAQLSEEHLWQQIRATITENWDKRSKITVPSSTLNATTMKSTQIHEVYIFIYFVTYIASKSLIMFSHHSPYTFWYYDFCQNVILNSFRFSFCRNSLCSRATIPGWGRSSLRACCPSSKPSYLRSPQTFLWQHSSSCPITIRYVEIERPEKRILTV